MRVIARIMSTLVLLVPINVIAESVSKAESAGRMGDEEVTIRAVHLNESVWMISGRGGNIGLSVGADGVYMIDDQYAPLTEPIRQVIGQITDQPVRFIINTHLHGDHVGGNEQFKDLGALIVAHDNVRGRMSRQQDKDLFGREIPAYPEASLPVATFTDALTFHLNGETVRAFHVAQAHTDGDVIVHFKAADVIHMGDVFWYGLYPFIDTANGGSIRGVIMAIDAVLPLIGGETRVIPGHGPLSGKTELVEFRDMLQGIADRIQSLIDEGRSLEETQAATPTADWDEKWGQGFISPATMVKMVYQDLGRQSSP